MNEVTLPASPNWYRSSILTCSNDGTVAWGSKNMIVVAKPRDDSKTLNYSVINNAHLVKVNSLAFSPEYGEPGKNLLVSGGDENIMRIWDLDTMSAIHSQFYTDTKQTIIGVDWSRSDPTLVCSVSTEGSLIAWNINYPGSTLIGLGKITATCIACCPHNSEIVSVGTKSGLVYIVNLRGTGSITYKLRGHDVEITSLSWCPSEINVLEDKGSNVQLLASGAKDKTIFVWKAGTDGRCEAQLSLPTNPLDSQQHRTKHGNFTVLCWLRPRYLLASSQYGELLGLDLSVSMKKPNWKIIHGNHSRGLFVISSYPTIVRNENEENWREDKSFQIWTTAQDRQIICSTIDQKSNSTKIQYSIPTQTGFIYCLAACPLDTTRIAFGAGDAQLRLWNLSEPHVNSFDVVTMWQKISGRITAIAWHPEQENLLAFGTYEGRVGLYDTNHPDRPPILYHQHHRRTVYTLGWAPYLDNQNQCLYSCGETELICYNAQKTAKPQVIVQKDCTEFMWKPDLSCLALGFEDGSISFKNSKLEDCGRSIATMTKTVQCLAWHPDSTASDLSLSPMRNYLAVATRATSVIIYDMTTLIERLIQQTDDTKSEDKDADYHRIVCTLNGHSDRVVALAWSPHTSGYLVSGGFDNTAQVWKIDTQELIATYTGHSGAIYSCMWSPMDPDFIITGSTDFFLRIWSLSSQKVIMPTEIKKTKNKKKAGKKQKNITLVSSNEQVNLTSVQSTSTDNITNGNLKDDSETVKVENIKDTKYKNKNKEMFSVHQNMMRKNPALLSTCLNRAQTKTEIIDNRVDFTDSEDTLPIFGSKNDISKILIDGYETLTATGDHMMATEISMWNNNLQQQLQNAAEEQRLNEFLVSLAPSVSVDTWHEMCEKYAVQLIREGNPTKAVSYLLAIHRIHRAVEVLLESRMFTEAYVLAKFKLDHNDPVLNHILKEWSHHVSASEHSSN